ncbi:peptidase M1 [Sediminibacterium sp. TEGAF015]|nr:peptidase M1 [Sediminibacterium sp. TEGAF015]
MQIDLVAPLAIDSVIQDGKSVAFRQVGDIWYLQLNKQRQSSKKQVTIYYAGKPIESLHAPWDGGMVWSKDSLGRPWISVACQYKGASLWFPCKNHLSDEPENGATISVIVPDSLIAVSNGRLIHQQQLAADKTLFRWQVKSPINHYGISFYIGKYVHLSGKHNGKNGLLSTDFWVLDYNRQKAIEHLMPQIDSTLVALENCFGPYPFYNDGFKMVDAPYIGMEHQSAIAYGSSYRKGTNVKGGDISNTGWGKKTDRILVHETAHEWFGNSITASDIADRWIQEGFVGLAEELVIAHYWGEDAGNAFMQGRFRTIENDKPVIGKYGINEDGSQDNYVKGWAVMHMIKTMLSNNNRFIQLLRKLNREFFHHVVTSREVEAFFIRETKLQLKPFFDQYLRSAQVPILQYVIKDNQIKYRFVNCNSGFTMPLKTNITGKEWIYPTASWKTVPIKGLIQGNSFQVDTNFYIQTEQTN